jgi:hypothetical protein
MMVRPPLSGVSSDGTITGRSTPGTYKQSTTPPKMKRVAPTHFARVLRTEVVKLSDTRLEISVVLPVLAAAIGE